MDKHRHSTLPDRLTAAAMQPVKASGPAMPGV